MQIIYLYLAPLRLTPHPAGRVPLLQAEAVQVASGWQATCRGTLRKWKI